MAKESTPLNPEASGPGGTFSPALGLSSKEAAERLERDGPNELDPPKTESFLSILATQMKNVIFLLTIIASTICWLLGDRVKAYILICIVGGVCLANAIGEHSAQDAGAALKSMAAPVATAMRDGEWKEVEAKELVVGDVVKIAMGGVVPADLHVLESVDLHTNESALTGEPMEVLKTLEPKDHDSNFPSDMMFNATQVVAGHGMAEVVSTGMKTQVGLIAKRLQVEDATLNMNPLQTSINTLGRYIGVVCAIVVVVATATGYFTKYQNPMAPCADDDDFCLLMTSVVRGVIMAISIIPHGLPFVVMVMLTVGAKELGKIHGVVTRRSAVDYLGATTVICTDKTGTLTEGKMTAEALTGFCREGGAGTAEESELELWPLKGFSPNGGIFTKASLSDEAKTRMNTKWSIKEKHVTYSEPNLQDLADPAQPAESRDALLARAHLASAFLNCYGTVLSRDQESGGWRCDGNMSEAALKVAAAKGSYWDADFEGEAEGLGAKLQEAFPRDASLEVPFTSKRKMMASVHELPSTGEKQLASLRFAQDATHVVVIKGAPDKIMPKIGSVLSHEGGAMKCPGGKITPAELEALQQKNSAFSDQALRTLLLAVCPLTAKDVEALRAAEGSEDILQLILENSALSFLSLWGIRDPPRAAVPPSIDECHNAGIRVVMITGDQRPTAVAIGRQVRIIMEEDDPELCAALSSDLHVSHMHMNPIQRQASAKVGDELKREGSRHLVIHDAKEKKDEHEADYKSAEDMAKLTCRVNIWSRALPTDKVAIVDSLRDQGHIAAMTGDGVNDAPALKHAHVGTAMGISGTAVTKQAADLILMDDNFATIVAAVREGRRIYANTQKYVVFNLSIKAGECTCLLLAIILGVPMPIRGLQLLFNLVATHILPTLALAWEGAESYIMNVPPRATKGDLVVTKTMWIFKWFPFVCSMVLTVLSCLHLGVWTHTGFLHGNSLIGSSRVGKLEDGHAACSFAGDLDADGRSIEDMRPFHCRCMVHPNGLPWEEAVQVDQWGRVHSESELQAVFDPWSGDTGSLFHQSQTPWKDGRDSLVAPCTDHRGVSRWCWKQGDVPEEELPLLPKGMTCAAYGTQLGQTMAYVSIHLGEILSLISYRTDGFFLQHLFANTVFLGFLVFNWCALATFLYSPVNQILGLAPLTAGRLGQAVCFPLVLLLLNEIVKVAYRSQVHANNLVLAEEAKSLVRGHKEHEKKEV